MSEVQTNNLFETLKSILKQKGYNYKELGELIGMSESGIKKIMTQGDCNLTKLEEICEAIGVNMADLWQLASKVIPKPVKFNKEQENIFLENPSLYFYFRALLSSDFDEARLLDEIKISKKSSFRYLKKLDEIKMIELGCNNKIKSKFKNATAVWNTPKLGDMNSRTIHDKFLEFARTKLVNQTSKVSLGNYGSYFLKEESALEMKAALLKVFDEFYHRSKRELLVHSKEDLVSMTVMTMMMDGFDETKHYPIEEC